MTCYLFTVFRLYTSIIIVEQHVHGARCGVLESANGFITVTWHYNYTGGLPITNISVSYNVNNGESNTRLAETESDATAVKVQDLKLGFEYVFTISARNNHGSTSILCGPILYVTGA